MTLEEFAKKAGCIVSINSDDGWEGKYQYQHMDALHVSYCGYRTERSAYKAFLTENFGPVACNAIILALKLTEDAATQDAKRYKWLRSHGFAAGHGSITVFLDDRCGTGNMHLPIQGKQLDEAIDAAMNTHKGT